MTLQTDEAKATAAEINAGNVAFERAAQVAEAQAEVTIEQASQLDQVMEELVEELQDREEAAGQA